MLETLKIIISHLIGFSVQSDCEMWNMGDWTSDQMESAIARKTEVLNKLKEPDASLADVPPEYLYQAMHDLALYIRTFGPEDGMDEMQAVEHKLAKHIQRLRVKNVKKSSR